MRCYLDKRPADVRGNSYDRRQRKLWLLTFWGDGKRCNCHYCGKWLDYDTLTVDRIVPGFIGGRYTKNNIVPACLRCNIYRYAKTTPRRFFQLQRYQQEIARQWLYVTQ